MFSSIVPVEKRGHFGVRLSRRRRVIMHAFASVIAGDDLHRSCRRVAPGSHSDLFHVAAARRKERCMPAEESLCRELGFEFLSGVEHHLDNAFDIAICRRQSARVRAKATRER